jgi:hypothetical protein
MARTRPPMPSIRISDVGNLKAGGSHERPVFSLARAIDPSTSSSNLCFIVVQATLTYRSKLARKSRDARVRPLRQSKCKELWRCFA